MTRADKKNLAASVHQRLLNVSRETDRPFNEVLQYFAMERLLYRFSRSSYDVLKADIIQNETLQKQWSAFLTKTGVTGPESFHDVLSQLKSFLEPLFERANNLD